MVVLDKIIQVGGAKVVLFGAKCVFQIKLVNAKLVGHHHIGIVRNALSDPVVPADGLQPPDFVHVLERNAVYLVLPYIHTAREGVLRLGKLLEKYGTYEMNGIAFQDVHEICWLETIGGHHWIAKRVPGTSG